jgi:formate-dependent nitrite reductase cytochrome c552 subunit
MPRRLQIQPPRVGLHKCLAGSISAQPSEFPRRHLRSAAEFLRASSTGASRPKRSQTAATSNPNPSPKQYDPNQDASRQELRSFACGQCHVEYYCGPKLTLFFPWSNGLRVEQIEATYDATRFPDGERFYDWQHAETGAHVLKAQHPEFETWSQGVHARAGVACADCHMPYQREGALKITDHHVQSPLLNINRACQTCHRWPEEELKARAEANQQRVFGMR